MDSKKTSALRGVSNTSRAKYPSKGKSKAMRAKRIAKRRKGEKRAKCLHRGEAMSTESMTIPSTSNSAQNFGEYADLDMDSRFSAGLDDVITLQQQQAIGNISTEQTSSDVMAMVDGASPKEAETPTSSETSVLDNISIEQSSSDVLAMVDGASPRKADSPTSSQKSGLDNMSIEQTSSDVMAIVDGASPREADSPTSSQKSGLEGNRIEVTHFTHLILDENLREVHIFTILLLICARYLCFYLCLCFIYVYVLYVYCYNI